MHASYTASGVRHSQIQRTLRKLLYVWPPRLYSIAAHALPRRRQEIAAATRRISLPRQIGTLGAVAEGSNCPTARRQAIKMAA
jgi:hypothetical protein